MANYRYGRYTYGPDPLALPYDVRGAVDEMSDSILAGGSPAAASRPSTSSSSGTGCPRLPPAGTAPHIPRRRLAPVSAP